MQPQPEQHHYHGSPVQHQPQQEVQQPAADTPQEQQQPLQQHGEEVSMAGVYVQGYNPPTAAADS
jgi:hypothetical protein